MKRYLIASHTHTHKYFSVSPHLDPPPLVDFSQLYFILIRVCWASYTFFLHKLMISRVRFSWLLGFHSMEAYGFLKMGEWIPCHALLSEQSLLVQIPSFHCLFDPELMLLFNFLFACAIVFAYIKFYLHRKTCNYKQQVLFICLINERI